MMQTFLYFSLLWVGRLHVFNNSSAQINSQHYLDQKELNVHVAHNAAEDVLLEELAFGAVHGQHIPASQHLG